MAHVTLKPGALRELHGHPNADEWQYYIQGSGRMTCSSTAPRPVRSISALATSASFRRRLVTVSRLPATPLWCSSRCFKAPRFQDISFNDWLTHIPPELVIEHLGISQQTLSAIPRANYAVPPA
jgi:oxalate decarboxylase